MHPSVPELCRNSRARWLAFLFNHPVRAHEQQLRNLQADRLGGLQVDHQLELSRLLNRQVGGFCSLEDLVHVNRAEPIKLLTIWSVTGPESCVRVLRVLSTPRQS